MAKHARCSPSRLSRIILCPGSLKLCEAYIGKHGESTSEAASMGTQRHYLTEKALSSGLDSIKHDVTGDDEFNLIAECVELSNSILLAGSKNIKTVTEEKVTLEKWGVPQVWGTLDRGIYDASKLELDVIDWKFGYNVVDAYKNPQLLAYAAGLVAKFNATQLRVIRCHVFQPTRDHHSVYELTLSELHAWVHGTLAIAIDKALHSDELNPSSEACMWCDVRSTCRARYDMAQETAGYIFELQLAYDKGVIPPEELAQAYARYIPLVEFMKDIYSYGLRELDAGRPFPGYKAVRGRANRKWSDEDSAARWCATNLPGIDIFDTEFKSAAKLEGIDKSLKKNQEFQALITKPPGKLTMVPESDRREAVQPESSATEVFEKFKIT